jgi:hypothetical protein
MAFNTLEHSATPKLAYNELDIFLRSLAICFTNQKILNFNQTLIE